MGVQAVPVSGAADLEARLSGESTDAGAQPAGVLIDLELGDEALQMITVVKARDPELQVVAFGSHVATAQLQAAHARGADTVLPRSRFNATLPQVLRQLHPQDP